MPKLRSRMKSGFHHGKKITKISPRKSKSMASAMLGPCPITD